jgi:hypothetical protein
MTKTESIPVKVLDVSGSLTRILPEGYSDPFWVHTYTVKGNEWTSELSSSNVTEEEMEIGEAYKRRFCDDSSGPSLKFFDITNAGIRYQFCGDNYVTTQSWKDLKEEAIA